MEVKRKVSYFYDAEVGSFYYGQNHPMKPHRVRMAHNLIMRYGLYKQMQVFKPNMANLADMAAFHEEDYLEFLRNASSSTAAQMAFKADLNRFNLAGDCPVFDGLYRYCQLYSGASIGGAVKLNYGESDVVINWAGGLHHAKKSEASGFCYVNDIVLAILELLKYKQRVVYVDIDIHHGDGVEEAFLTTDRVLTVSFHKFGGDFFPGTGDITNVGAGLGTYYKVNVPLEDGMDDDSFEFLFKPIMERVMAQYQPEAIVLQSGADSLTGDRLGVFNLSTKGHAECHKYMLSFGLPMLVLGGGGYKIKNVARCWTYETAVLLGVEGDLPDEMPPNEYYEYFGPDYSLQIPMDPNRPNKNSRESLEKVRAAVLENLKLVRPVSVGIHERPPDAIPLDSLTNMSLTEHNAAASGHAHTQQLWKPPPRREEDLDEDIDILASDDEDFDS